jgi:hypothetical protein
MIFRENDEDSFFPKASCLTAVSDRLAREKGNIHAMMLDGSNVLCGPVLGKIEMNKWILRLIGLRQVGEKARCQRRKGAPSAWMRSSGEAEGLKIGNGEALTSVLHLVSTFSRDAL